MRISLSLHENLPLGHTRLISPVCVRGIALVRNIFCAMPVSLGNVNLCCNAAALLWRKLYNCLAIVLGTAQCGPSHKVTACVRQSTAGGPYRAYKFLRMAANKVTAVHQGYAINAACDFGAARAWNRRLISFLAAMARRRGGVPRSRRPGRDSVRSGRDGRRDSPASPRRPRASGRRAAPPSPPLQR